MIRMVERNIKIVVRMNPVELYDRHRELSIENGYEQCVLSLLFFSIENKTKNFNVYLIRELGVSRELNDY